MHTRRNSRSKHSCSVTPGVGKTTELTRLLRDLDDRFYALRLSVTSELNPGTLRYYDVLLLILVRLVHAVSQPSVIGFADTDLSNMLDAVRDHLATKWTKHLQVGVAEFGAGLTAPFFLKLFGNIKQGRTRERGSEEYELSLVSELTELMNRDVAMTLNNLAILYGDTQRVKDSEASYQQALRTYRSLAETNPEAYLPDVALTLNNLAVLYAVTKRMKEAAGSNGEARAILEPLWCQNPELHGNQLAKINLVAARLASPDRPNDACKFARQALAAAYDPALKQYAQDLIDQFCQPPPQEPA